MRFFLQLFTSLLLLVGQTLYASAPQLKKSDVRATLEDMFSYHVEHKELTPLLIKRSIKLYIEQFDEEKMYLLNSEIAPFLNYSESALKEVIAKIKKDDLSFYLQLNQTLQTAIVRARNIREEMERELIISPSDGKQVTGGSYLSFPSSEKELKQRIKKQLVGFQLNGKKSTPEGNWTPSRREKIFSLLEKRLRRNEEPYFIYETKGRLVKEGLEEHYFVLHILKALAKSLDSHTSYFSPEEAMEMRTSLEKQFEGIGIGLKESVDGVVITELIKGGPAHRSGKVQVGDFLAQIDRISLENAPYEEVLVRLKAEGKPDVELGLKRLETSGKYKQTFVRLVKERILMQDARLQYSSEPFADGIIGKITLPSFYEGGNNSTCEKDMKEAIKSLKNQGKLYGLVVDLRYNSGGFLNQAVKVAGLFITSGVIVISKYSQGEVQYLRTVDGRSYFNGPVVVLTSKASASAAEIVAQALQDYGAALIVGDERTYGKGTIQYQTVTDKEAKSYFKVTVGRYYTVSGKSTQIEGVKADLVVPTEYSQYNIGERFLEYPLTNDKMPPAFLDPLTDVDDNSKVWLQKNYVPQIQQRTNRLNTLLPSLKKNSTYRLAKDKNFQSFLSSLEPPKENSSANLNWGVTDLQMDEAVNILKDMYYLSPN